MATNGSSPIQRSAIGWIMLAYIICTVVGGTIMFAIRRTVADGGYPVYGAAGLRFSTACGLYLFLWWLGFGRGKPLTRAQVLWLAVAGLASASSHLLLYNAARSLEAGPANAILALCPFVAGVLGWRSKTAGVSARGLVSAAICAVGVAALFWARRQAEEDWQSLLLVGGATIIMAICNLALKQQDAPVTVQASIFFLAAAPTIWIFHCVSGQSLPDWPPPLEPTLWLGYTVLFASGISFSFYLWLVQRVKLLQAMSVSFIQPIVGLIIDSFFEPRSPTLNTYLGVLLIALGVALGGIGKKQQAAASQDPKAPTPEPGANGLATKAITPDLTEQPAELG